jgi:hypothetical protein
MRRPDLELRCAQLELVTPPASTVAGVNRELAVARRILAGRLRGGLRLAALGAIALALSPAAAAAAPARHGTDFKVLWVVVTAGGLYLSQDHVGATEYTLDLHNTGADPARFQIGAPGSKLVDVTLKPNAWRFPRVTFKPSTTYAVKVSIIPGPTTYAASIPSQ